MIMQVEHLSKSFGGRTLFSDVTFKLEEYDRLALVGPNGAGKTTMLNIISGREDADEGRILFAKGARVGYLEQEAIEMPDRPIFEEVMASQVEILETERRLHRLEASLGENPTEQQLAAARHIGKRGLNVAQTEQYIDRLTAENRTEPPRRRPTYVIKDVRLFLNSVERGVRLMQSAGVGAEVGRRDTEEEILLTIHIPKRREAGVVTES